MAFTVDERIAAVRMVFEYGMLRDMGVDLSNQVDVDEALPFVRSTFWYQRNMMGLELRGLWWRLMDWADRLTRRYVSR